MTSAAAVSLLPERMLDRTGVVASVGCAIHCLIAPGLVLLAPALGGWWVHPLTHLLIAALVLPVAGLALARGYRQHHRRWIPLIGGLGMAMVVLGAVLPWLLSTGAPPVAEADAAASLCRECCPTIHVDAVTGTWALRVPPASIVTMLGGVALIVAHVANLRCACPSCRSGCALGT